jgi:2-dehydropantoate 2-reductase
MAMKIGIVGAGAIGGLLGAKLALAGEQVVFVEANAAHRDAINKNGLKLIMHGGEELIAKNARAVASLDEPGPQDLVIVAVKAHQIPLVAPGLKKLYGKDTIVMTVQNGLPWWYFHKHGGPLDGKRLTSVDPDGSIDANIEPDRIIGCVVYPAGEVIAPGVIKHVEGDRFSVGELDGSKSNRVEMIANMLIAAGFKSFVLDNVRAEIWLKAWGNLSFNPISALTHGTLEGIARYPHTRDLAANMMAEAQTIANKLGITFRHTIEKRIQGAESVGPHKTSMLQDVEHGRSLEIEALVGSVVELGRLTDTPTPHISAVYACCKLLDKVMAEEHAAIAPQKLA